MTVHFIERCRERGLSDVAEELRDALVRALRLLKDGSPIAGDLIEHVFDLPTHGKCKAKAIYRFQVGETRYYAVVVNHSIPVTVLTQDMLAYYRAKNRKPSKGGRKAVSKANAKSIRSAPK